MDRSGVASAAKPLLPKSAKGGKALPQDKGWTSFSEGAAGASLALLVSAAIGTGGCLKIGIGPPKSSFGLPGGFPLAPQKRRVPFA